MNFLKINYEGGGLARVIPEYVAFMRYYPQKNDGEVVFSLKNGKEINIIGCTEDDAQKYIKRWKEALEANQGQLSDIPLLPNKDEENGKTDTESTESK